MTNGKKTTSSDALVCQLLVMGHQPMQCQLTEVDLHGCILVSRRRFSEFQNSEVAPMLAGDRVDVVVTISPDTRLRISVQVKAVIGTKLQLSYLQENDINVRRLLKHTKGARSSRRSGGPEAVLEDMQYVCKRFLQAVISAFFTDADETLFALAREAKTNQEQQKCFEALNQLHAKRKIIANKFVATVLEQLGGQLRAEHDNAGESNKLAESARTKQQELSVVEKTAFEDWLAVNRVIDQVKNLYHESLAHLQKRFSVLMEAVVEEDDLPFGIARLCHAFHEPISLLNIDRSLFAVLYQCFEEQVESGLESFYSDINNCFRDHGILADLEDGETKVDAQAKNDKSNKSAMSSSKQQPVQSSSGESAGTVVEKDFSRRTVENASLAANATQDFNSYYAQPAVVSEDAVKLYSAVKNLMSLRRQSQKLRSSGAALAQSQSVVSQQDQVFEEDILNVLADPGMETQAMHAIAAGVPLTKWIGANSRQAGTVRKLSAQVEEQVDLVESLFNSIVKECGVSDTVSPLLKQLEVPYLKVVLNDKDFLLDCEHPARLLLNQLAQWVSYSDLTPRVIENKLDAISEKLVSEGVPGREVFSTILADINRLTVNQQNAHARNAQRIARSCDGQEKLEEAHQSVKEALSKRLLGRKIPAVVLSLLDAGWRDLLIQTYFKSGSDSHQWQENLSVIDQLMRWLDEDEPEVGHQLLDREIEAETFIDLIGRELDAGFPGQFKHVSVVRNLRQILCRDTIDTQSLDIVELDPKDDWYGIELASRRVTSNKENDDSLHRWFLRAVELEVGDWLGSVNSDDRQTDMLLTWRSQDGKRFVFVNRQGQKVADLMLWELADRMKKGCQRIEQSREWTPVDKSLYGVLQKVYDELDYHRCHDELTGLINRKEFENVVNRTLYVAKREDSHHVLFNVNIDQFNVVNDYCGVVAGDQCLKEVSRIIGKTIPSDAVMARFGGNEFAVLLENYDGDKGYLIAEAIRDLVQKYRFEWQGKTFSFTASIGMVVMDQFSDSFVNLIKDTNAACSQAKEEGRNRIIWSKEVDEKRRKRDDVLEWVAKINRALDEDRLVLRCQQIKPLGPNQQHQPHYEILLSVREDEKSILVPPDRFIEAAERYNRMQDVDRWVVRNALMWMAEHPQKLEKMRSLSINLSGNTMNDDHFLDFLNDQFQRYPVAAGRVCFEVTETTTIANLSKAADFIREVKKLGCEFALDDFGTGMSSYEYLKRLPVDYLKIDGIFIKDIASNPFDFAVVKSINEIGHFMGKRTIAEYVENNEILELLQEIGVDYAQGYGVEKPRILGEM